MAAIVNGFNDRLLLLVRDKGMTDHAFAKMINVDSHQPAKYFSGGTIPRVDVVFRILDSWPDVSAEWLLRGTGSMYLGKQVGGSVQGDMLSTESAKTIIDENRHLAAENTRLSLLNASLMEKLK